MLSGVIWAVSVQVGSVWRRGRDPELPEKVVRGGAESGMHVIKNRSTATQPSSQEIPRTDILLIGGGIMSATLGTLFQQLGAGHSIHLIERADDVAMESSNDWNNAGTGHASLCELNYTPEIDGQISTSRSVKTAEQFQESRILWARLVEQGTLSSPKSFIRSVPHMSFVTGAKDVTFLRHRFEAMVHNPLFADMEYSEDRARLAEWAPLMMEGRDHTTPVAMSRSISGTDVNFGEITRQMVRGLAENGATVQLGHEVTDLEKLLDNRWRVTIRNRRTGETSLIDAAFVFIGAGGRSIHLLQKSGIRGARGYGGFPVSGQFLRCTNREVIARHNAKVYGKPQLKAPPLSMPHLDTRVVNGEQVLLFGPYAGFSPRFLKQGSLLDLPKSIAPDNILTMLSVARDEWPLTMYLAQQVMQKHVSRINVLQNFVPQARAEDWSLTHAGMRVQVMKRTATKRGSIEYGTELLTSDDGTLAGLLGASPGASTAVTIMIDVLERCFAAEYKASWKKELTRLIPSHGVRLAENQKLLDEVTTFTRDVLKLDA
jgi:malate dehydrogenase (quinone)